MPNKLGVEIIACRGIPEDYSRVKMLLTVGSKSYETKAVSDHGGAADFSGESFSFFIPPEDIDTSVLSIDLLEDGMLGATVRGKIVVRLSSVPKHQEHRFALPFAGCSGQCFAILRPEFGSDPVVNKEQPQVPLPYDPQQQQQLYQGQVQQPQMMMMMPDMNMMMAGFPMAAPAGVGAMPQPGYMMPPQQQGFYGAGPAPGFGGAAAPYPGGLPPMPAAYPGMAPGGGYPGAAPAYDASIGKGDDLCATGVPAQAVTGAVVAPLGASVIAGAAGAGAFSLGPAGDKMPNPPPGACDLGRDVNGEHIGAGAILRDTSAQGARLEGAFAYDAHIRNSQIIGGAYEGCSFKSCQMFAVQHAYDCKFEDCVVDARCVITKPKRWQNCSGDGKVVK